MTLLISLPFNLVQGSKTMIFSSNKSWNKSKAFTLIELLIVIGIIMVLVSLSAGGVFKVLSYQKQAATDRTVDQVNSAIERVLKNIRAKAHSDYPNTPLKSVMTLIGFNRLQNNVPSLIGIREPNRRDELVFVDLQIARSFPLNFDNINGANKITVNFIPIVNVANQFVINSSFNNEIAAASSTLVNNLNVIPSITQAFNSITGTSSSPSLDIQNSACLLMALEANPDGLKGEFLGTAVKTDAASKVRYIAAADGQPICFQLKYLDSQSSTSKSVVGTVTVELIVP
jgi:type II secretory pathway pseudopilin PulG